MPDSTSPPPELAGKRILLVEDNFLVALSLKARLLALACEVIGPVARLSDALRLASAQALDGAILDINIVGGDSSPVAAVLARRHCPFLFITGYASPPMTVPEFADHPRLHKPIADDELAAALRQHLLKVSG